MNEQNPVKNGKLYFQSLYDKRLRLMDKKPWGFSVVRILFTLSCVDLYATFNISS